MSPKKFIQDQTRILNLYSGNLNRELFLSVKKILESGFRAVCNKRKIKDPNSEYIPQYLYQETRCRSHYGKNDFLGKYSKNIIVLSPTLDPELRTLKIDTAECSDPQLLIATIFTRYASTLLKFQFQGRRSIAPETIEYAQKLNERFPLHVINNNVEEFHLQPRDLQTKQILAGKQNNKTISEELSEACLKAAFESSRTYGLFNAYFDEELYRYAANYYNNNIFGRCRPLYAVTGIAKVLEDVEISNRNRPLYRDIQRFLEQDFATIHDETQILLKLRPYLAARIDVELIGKVNVDDFQILSVSDDKARITKPKWFQNRGVGYVITSIEGNLSLVVKTAIDGKICLNLRGLDMRDNKDRSKRVPYWIDYTKLNVNGKMIFDELTPTWHDKPYCYDIDVKASEETSIQVEWLPHRNDT